MASVVGRGRGRGRGIYTVPQRRPGEVTPEQNTTEVKENGQYSRNTGSDISDIERLLDDFRVGGSCERIIEEARKYATNEDRLSKIVEQICEKTFNDPEFSRSAAGISEKLCGVQFENGLSFRTSLLRKTQEYFKNRESFLKKSLKEWIGLVSFICQLFNALRINDQPLKPLAVPIYQMLNELLRGRRFEEVTCLHRQLKDVGSLLDTVDKEKMTELYMKMRILLVDSQSPEFTRLLLLELIELRSGNWNMSKDNAQYFADSRKELLGNAQTV